MLSVLFIEHRVLSAKFNIQIVETVPLSVWIWLKLNQTLHENIMNRELLSINILNFLYDYWLLFNINISGTNFEKNVFIHS